MSATARSSPRPRSAGVADTLGRLGSIVALADFSPKSDNAVCRAALLAREHGARLQLLHVVAPHRFAAKPSKGDELPVRLERAHRELATLAARTAKLHGVEAVCKVREGDALQVIVDEARDADLVVVAAKRSNPLRDFVLRTPTERLLRILQRPMLVVKRPAAAGDADTTRAADELVVVAKGGHASKAAFLLGTLAQRLVAHAKCDVLVVPQDAAAARRERALADACRRSAAIAPRRSAKPAS